MKERFYWTNTKEMIKMLNFDTNTDDFDKFRTVNNSAKEKK